MSAETEYPNVVKLVRTVGPGTIEAALIGALNEVIQQRDEARRLLDEARNHEPVGEIIDLDGTWFPSWLGNGTPEAGTKLYAAPVPPSQGASDAVPLDALVCVGRAQFPQRGGNAGLSWHVVDALGDTDGFRSGAPCNKELLFVIPAQFKRAAIIAAKEKK